VVNSLYFREKPPWNIVFSRHWWPACMCVCVCADVLHLTC